MDEQSHLSALSKPTVSPSPSAAAESLKELLLSLRSMELNTANIPSLPEHLDR